MSAKLTIDHYKKQLLKISLMLIYLAVNLTGLSTASAKEPSAFSRMDKFDTMDKFDKLEKNDDEEIAKLVSEVQSCSDIEQFDCARRAYEQARKIALTSKQKRVVDDARYYIVTAENRMLERQAQEEEARRIAEQRRIDREHEADMRRIYRKAMKEKAEEDARIAEKNRQLRKKQIEDSYKFQQDQIRRSNERSAELQAQKERLERESIERLNRGYYGQTAQNDSDAKETARLNERKRQEENQERIRQEQRDREEKALRIKLENEEKARLAAERKERELREIEDKKVRQKQEQEQRELSKRQERENAMQDLRSGTSLSARYCPGNDIRIVGTMPQSAKNKVGCVNVSYLASCPGESMNSGIRGNLYNFQGVATDCYLGDAAKLPRKPSCTAESLTVQVLSINSCSR